jgi:thiamine-phosphate pyrophosphorylase
MGENYKRLFYPSFSDGYFCWRWLVVRGIYRIVDANFNRAREGLRVIEELARFILDDACLSGRLKHLRHRLRVIQQTFPGGVKEFLAARDAGTDVGLSCREEKELDRLSCLELMLANFKRVQEALRVLEEYAKFVSTGREFKEMRFEIYELEKEMAGRLTKLNAAQNLVDYALYVIVQEEFSRGRLLVEVTGAAIAGGATVIQLRDKESSTRRLVEIGRELRRLTQEKEATFIINDRVDVALAVQADGVHLGQEDLPVAATRQILGKEKIIGVSAHTLEQAGQAQQQGADYIGVGPIFETQTKDVGYSPVGIKFLRLVAKEVEIPKVAIGGITAQNAFEIVSAGADGVAVVTAVVAAPDITAAASVLRAEVESARTHRSRYKAE